MSSKSKFQNSSDILLARLREDRISDLPTCLIVKIISILPTKDAVMTSALSTKWKHLWTFVTNLDLDHTLMDSTLSAKDFKRFVNRVLLLHDKSCLQRFRLKSENGYDGSLVNAWIQSILTCNLQELDLSVPIKHPVFLPSNIFLCKTLVVLKLDAHGKVNIPTSISLPSLKILHLDEVELSDDRSIVSLMCGCPVLEELSLRRCIGKDVRVINITSPTLINLTLVLLAYDVEIGSMKYRIVLDTTSLQYISVIDYVAEGYVVRNLCHLTSANIAIGDSEYDDGEMHTKALTDFFNAISHVQRIVLTSLSAQVISLFVEEFPEFSNLISLELDILEGHYVTTTTMMTLLKKSPRLETLCIQQVLPKKYNFFGLFIYDLVPSCFSSHLKFIEIVGFGGVQDEMRMVECILESAKVLEKLTLHYQPSVYDNKVGTSFLKKLVMLPRASTNCKVEVV